MDLRSRFEAQVLAAFGAAVLVVAVLAVATWKVSQDADEAARWVAHTHEMLNNLARARGDTLQIELSTQNYRLTGDPARLAERDAAIAARETALHRIRELTADNARQQERWTQVRKVADERLAIARRTELLRKTQGLEAASAYVASAPVRETRERMHRLLREMDEEERRLLEARSAEQSRTRQITVAADTLLALLLIVLLAATYVLIRRQLRETEASRRALAESEQNLSTTLHSIGDAVLATDTAGRITRMNPVAERLTGWPAAEAQGRPVDEVFRIISEETRAPAEVPVARVLATGEIQGLANHTLLIARDGSEWPIADSAAPIRDATGRVSGVVLVFRDVSVERQAERMIREQNELLEQRVRERTAQLRESEERFRLLVDGARDYAIVMLDPQGHVVTWNEGARRLKGYAEAEIVGQPMECFYAPEDVAAGKPARLRAQAAAEGRCEDEGWRMRKDGTRFYADVILTAIRSQAGELVGFAKITRDITERKRAEENIQKLNAGLEQHVHELAHVNRALRTLSAGNRTMLHATDEQGLLDSMCRAIVDAGGYHMALVFYKNDDATRTLRPMAESGYPGGLAALRALTMTWTDDEHGRGAVATAIRNGQPSVVRNMLTDPNYAPWRPHLHGSASSVTCPLRVDGEVIGALAIYAAEPDAFGADEVTLLTESADDLAFGITTLRARAEQQKTQVAMQRLSRYDALTGLPNETRFAESLTAAIDTSARLNQSFALLQINIERLREINDAIGFSYGDELLREFGARLGSAAPEPAVVARLRGDHFAILLPDSNANAAIEMARRLEEVLARPFLIAEIPLDVQSKIGIALFPEHGSTPHDLFRHMDIALQQARKKDVGYAVFDPAQNPDQPRRLAMAGELRRAIGGGGLLLYLQPKVEIATGRVCGAEGLVRWKHPERGLIAPGEFIGLAEHTGLIKPLTEWVIEEALRLNHAWQREGCALPIAVNLSARNLREEDLLEKIRRMQSTWSGGAGLLELEITESAVMDDPEYALRVLHRLRDDGIPLYIDDFGTGYSSLSYLQKLPVDYIKIDQSFVSAMATSKESLTIVRSTIDLAHDLGLKVVAEGVETQEDWNQLAALGCGIGQGYFLAKPMPAGAFQNWVRQFRPPVTSPF
ncbi:EAL domain-containing protein [Thiobacillus sp.]